MARSRSRNVRRWAARFLVYGYLVVFGVFWFEGSQAYLHLATGPARFLGFAYLPILLLPLIGVGTVNGIAVHSTVWLWLFTLQMFLGASAVFVYPSERPRWWSRPRARRAVGGSGDAVAVRSPRS